MLRSKNPSTGISLKNCDQQPQGFLSYLYMNCDQQPQGFLSYLYMVIYTPKTNMEPKNEGLEDDYPFQLGDFQVPCSFFRGVWFVNTHTQQNPTKKIPQTTNPNDGGRIDVQFEWLVLNVSPVSRVPWKWEKNIYPPGVPIGAVVVVVLFCRLSTTPPKFNMEPENTPLEKENHLPNHHFQVLC